MTTETKMLAFHGDPKIKAKYLARLRAHIKADELVRGATGEDGKGCAVWCTLDKYEHAAYPIELGIPEDLAYLEDELFENLPVRDAMDWPSRFLKAIKTGADLSGVIPQFVIWQYEDSKHGLMNLDEIKTDAGLRQVCEDLVSLFRREWRGETISQSEWLAIYDRARGAARAGAWARAWAGEWARAGARAREWARAGARARAGAWAGAWAGEWARAGAREYKIQADKLIELLESAPTASGGAK